MKKIETALVFSGAVSRASFRILMHLRPATGWCLVWIGLACSETPEIVRMGDDLPVPVDDHSSDGGEPGGSAGAANTVPVTWCDAREVLIAKCQRCHHEPPKNGAPMPLVVYEDTQAMWTITRDVHDVMLDAIERGFMPYVALNDPPTGVMPPVEPLTDHEKATLRRWLMEGAVPVGGTNCE